MKRQRYAWVTIAPATWLVICTVTAGLEKVFSSNPAVGFLAHARRFGDAVASGQVLAPAKSLDEMSRVIFNDYVDATLAAVFVAVVIATVVYGLINIRRALGSPQVTAVEIEFAGAAVGGHA
jgi:carbon starvation protein